MKKLGPNPIKAYTFCNKCVLKYESNALKLLENGPSHPYSCNDLITICFLASQFLKKSKRSSNGITFTTNQVLDV